MGTDTSRRFNAPCSLSNNTTPRLKLGQDARGTDTFGLRGEFLTLVNLAKSLDGGNRHVQREP